MIRVFTAVVCVGWFFSAGSTKALPLKFTPSTTVSIEEFSTSLEIYGVRLSDALSAIRLRWNPSTNSFDLYHVANIPSAATGWVGKWAVDWDRLCDGKLEGTKIPVTLSQTPLKCEWGTPTETCTNLKHTEQSIEFQVRNYVLKGTFANGVLSGRIYVGSNSSVSDGCWNGRKVQRISEDEWIPLSEFPKGE